MSRQFFGSNATTSISTCMSPGSLAASTQLLAGGEGGKEEGEKGGKEEKGEREERKKRKLKKYFNVAPASSSTA